jgi:hypothetical protein
LIVGVANHAASGVTDADAAYTPCFPSVLFEATFDNSAASPYTMLRADVGTEYGISIDTTTGFAYVNKAVTGADACFRILEGEVGTSQARVRGVFSSDTLLIKSSVSA